MRYHTSSSSNILLLLLAATSTTSGFRTSINHHVSAGHQHVPRQAPSYTPEKVASDICAANPQVASAACNSQQLTQVNAVASGYCDLTTYGVTECQTNDDSEYDDEPGCQQELANQASCNQTA